MKVTFRTARENHYQDKNKDVSKLLNSIVSYINIAKKLLNTTNTAKQRWKRKYGIILQLIREEAFKGNLYTIHQFCSKFEYKAGLDSKRSIRNYIHALITEGYIKFYKAKASRSKYGLLCLKDMHHSKSFL